MADNFDHLLYWIFFFNPVGLLQAGWDEVGETGHPTVVGVDEAGGVPRENLLDAGSDSLQLELTVSLLVRFRGDVDLVSGRQQGQFGFFLVFVLTEDLLFDFGLNPLSIINIKEWYF